MMSIGTLQCQVAQIRGQEAAAAAGGSADGGGGAGGLDPAQLAFEQLEADNLDEVRLQSAPVPRCHRFVWLLIWTPRSWHSSSQSRTP